MMQNLFKRFTAFLFLLLLTPKLGMEIYFHEVLHHSHNSQNSTSEKSSQLNIKCQCFDDVSMPLTQTAVVEISIPEKQSSIEFPEYINSFSFFLQDFSLLRGPPAA